MSNRIVSIPQFCDKWQTDKLSQGPDNLLFYQNIHMRIIIKIFIKGKKILKKFLNVVSRTYVFSKSVFCDNAFWCVCIVVSIDTGFHVIIIADNHC